MATCEKSFTINLSTDRLCLSPSRPTHNSVSVTTTNEWTSKCLNSRCHQNDRPPCVFTTSNNCEIEKSHLAIIAGFCLIWVMTQFTSLGFVSPRCLVDPGFLNWGATQRKEPTYWLAKFSWKLHEKWRNLGLEGDVPSKCVQCRSVTAYRLSDK